MKEDPEYYELRRTLEAYRRALKENGHYILSTDSDFLKFLEKGP
jgi:hypothetical protein